MGVREAARVTVLVLAAEEEDVLVTEAPPQRVLDGALVHMDDVDAHSERASAAGGTILLEPEGDRWMVARSDATEAR